MSAVAEQETDVLTIAALWNAIKKARHAHAANHMRVVLLTMHPRDLRDLRFEDRGLDVVRFDMVRDCWTAFGVPVTERRMPGATSDRLIVLQREALQLGHMPSNWQTLTVQDLNRTITEVF